MHRIKAFGSLERSRTWIDPATQGLRRGRASKRRGPDRYGPCMRRYLSGAIAVLFLTGCGGAAGGEAGVTGTPSALSPSTSTSTSTKTTSSPTNTATTSDEAALRTAVQAYSDAFLTGNGKEAYALLSTRCKERNTLAEFTAMTDQAKALYGDPLPMKSYEAQISGDMARVTYTYAISGINQTREPWVRESGNWHEDDC